MHRADQTQILQHQSDLLDAACLRGAKNAKTDCAVGDFDSLFGR